MELPMQIGFQVFGSEMQKPKSQRRASLQIAGSEAETQKPKLQWRAALQISASEAESQKPKPESATGSFQCRFQVFGSEIQKPKSQRRAPLQIAASEAEFQKPKLQWRAALQISGFGSEIQKLKLHWSFDFGYISQTYGIWPRVVSNATTRIGRSQRSTHNRTIAQYIQ